MNTDDIVEINQVMALYPHVIDAKQWDRLDELYTDDGVFDLSGLMGTELRYEGIDAIKGFLTSMPMPLAHISTNHYVFEADGKTQSRGKWFMPTDEGTDQRRHVPRHLDPHRPRLADAGAPRLQLGGRRRRGKAPDGRNSHDSAAGAPAWGYPHGHANEGVRAAPPGAVGSPGGALGEPGRCGERHRAPHRRAGPEHGRLRPGDVHLRGRRAGDPPGRLLRRSCRRAAERTARLAARRRPAEAADHDEQRVGLRPLRESRPSPPTRGRSASVPTSRRSSSSCRSKTSKRRSRGTSGSGAPRSRPPPAS